MVICCPICTMNSQCHGCWLTWGRKNPGERSTSTFKSFTTLVFPPNSADHQLIYDHANLKPIAAVCSTLMEARSSYLKRNFLNIYSFTINNTNVLTPIHNNDVMSLYRYLPECTCNKYIKGTYIAIPCQVRLIHDANKSNGVNYHIDVVFRIQ